MTSPSTRGTAAAVVTVLATLLTATGCGSGGGPGVAVRPSASATAGTTPYPTPPARSGSTPGAGVPRPADVDQRDADAVARGALTVMWTFDTTADSGPHDAAVRAADAGWLTEAYANRLRAHSPRSAPDVQWRDWADHRVRTVVTLKKTEDAARPPDTGTEAWRQWAVTTTPTGRGGRRGTPTTVVTYVRLTRATADGPWRVADVSVS
ncbi:hypothetical protein SUDANB145_05216 [Streptomyces sp. enrichment culture]|uniref:hypothetical protein n=1 Tax=Streptomyces sp. enrichment culture TaxID=1795815 RepID=UPI003F54F222